MQKTDNRTNGGRFEQELSHILSEHGFWVHVFQQNKSGQPADIIAIKGKFHTMIDCKVISNKRDGFKFERVEENQRLAMKMFTRKSNELCYFALLLPEEKDNPQLVTERIRLVSLSRIETLRARGNKSITQRMIDTETWSLNAWLDSSEVWSEDT